MTGSIVPEWWWETTTWEDDQPVRRSQATTAATLLAHLATASDHYLEVARSADAYPMLALGVTRGFAVVHLFGGPEFVSLRHGDGSIPAGVQMDVQVQDGLEPFTGEFVLEHSAGLEVVARWVRGEPVEDLGVWELF